MASRRLAQRARELERDGDGEIAEGARRRHFDGERRHVGDAEVRPDRVADGVVHVSLKAQNHVRVACEPAPGRAKLVIRLQFVTLKRLGICVPRPAC